MARCQGIIGAIFGHKFSARYTKRAPQSGQLSVRMSFDESIAELCEALSTRVYECDVCERCGAMAEREKGAEE